ncbi:MAG: hypothetical protein GY839_12070 [candidate division Zixibacteria bacterium]|nr:hypothetical protein [candidate division Zixibacteria bacterium]
MTKFTHIIGKGSRSSENILANFDIEKIVDASSDQYVKSSNSRANQLTVPADSCKILLGSGVL